MVARAGKGRGQGSEKGDGEGWVLGGLRNLVSVACFCYCVLSLQ